MFLETFKAFDRILQDRLLFRLKQNDIRGNLSGNLRGRIQRVLFNGQHQIGKLLKQVCYRVQFQDDYFPLDILLT